MLVLEGLVPAPRCLPGRSFDFILDEILWFTFFFLQVNRFSTVEDRAIFVTDRHLYKMDPTKQYKVMKTIPLYNVSVLASL